MFSKILVGTSLSETSSRTLCCLKGLQRAGAREVILLHAMNIRDVGTLYYLLRNLAQPALERQKAFLEEMGFSVEAEISLGIPYYEINKLARERGASLIAVHMTADTLVDEAFVGGVAYEVIQHADRPVLVMKARVREGACELMCQEILGHVLHPTDFSDNAEGAFEYVEKLVESGCPKVTLLHVQDRSRIDEARLETFNEIDRSRLEALRDRLLKKGNPEVAIDLHYGSPTSEVLRLSRQGRHSLVVMGTQGKGFLKEVFLGSLSHNVVRKAPLPVLLVPLR